MTSLHVGFLYMAPWLALLAALVCGRYPGERVIARVRAHRMRGGRIPVTGVSVPRATSRRVACGGLLLAWRLAGRGPPQRPDHQIKSLLQKESK